MEVQSMAHGALCSRFKLSTARALHTSSSRPNPAANFSVAQCGAASSRHSLSSSRRSPIVLPGASSRFVVRAAKESKGKDSKGKDSKGKKKGGKGGGGGGGGGGGSKGQEPAKRPNVWSKDIAETEYQAARSDAKPKQKERESRARGGNGFAAPLELPTTFDDDYTGVVATGAIPVETEEILQAPEQMPSPLWPTFVSSNAGVWRGVGAAFSPITAEMEPVALGSSREYLYDAAVLCSVEAIPGLEEDEINGTSLFRKVMWKVGNDQGELGFEEFQEEFLEEDLSGDLEGINPIELESYAIAEGMVYPPEVAGGEFGTVDETKEFLQGSGPALYNPEKETQRFGVLRETDPEWESMFEAGIVDAGLVEELKTVAETIKFEDNDGVWKDVMEEDTMSLEPGLVFFSDGSYSRGPLSLIPEDLATSDIISPTFKIEQCLVTGKHRRLRLVHTIAIMESGEEIQVLRVAAYEEQWMGPRNMESISESGGVFQPPFSQRDRLAPTALTGAWKTFEMSATAIHSPDATPLTRPSFVHFTQEIMLNQGLPAPLLEYEGDEDGEPIAEDPAVLWLPGGITASVLAKEEGVLTVGVGWFYDEGCFLTMERDYGPDGKLSEVRSQTKVKGGWAGGRM